MEGKVLLILCQFWREIQHFQLSHPAQQSGICAHPPFPAHFQLSPHLEPPREGEKPPPKAGTAGITHTNPLLLSHPPPGPPLPAQAPFEAIPLFPGAPRIDFLQEKRSFEFSPPCRLCCSTPIWFWLTPGRLLSIRALPSLGGREEQGRSQQSPELRDPEPSRSSLGVDVILPHPSSGFGVWKMGKSLTGICCLCSALAIPSASCSFPATARGSRSMLLQSSKWGPRT